MCGLSTDRGNLGSDGGTGSLRVSPSDRDGELKPLDEVSSVTDVYIAHDFLPCLPQLRCLGACSCLGGCWDHAVSDTPNGSSSAACDHGCVVSLVSDSVLHVGFYRIMADGDSCIWWLLLACLHRPFGYVVVVATEHP